MKNAEPAGMGLTAVHYGKPGRHYPHVLLRPFLLFLMTLEDFLGEMSPNVKFSLNLNIKAQNLHKTNYFSS